MSDNTVTDPLPGYVLDGQAPDEMTVLVDIAIPLRNIAALSSVASAVSDFSSPTFGHYFTKEQIKERFLPTQEFQAMLNYLAQAKLRVVSTALDSMITISATAAQVKQYFHTTVNMYTNGSSSYYMTESGARVNNARLLASNVTNLLARPQFVSETAPQGSTARITYTMGGLSAKELPEVYNATSLYKQGFQGEQQTIGVLDFFGSPTVNQDLQLFSEKYGFPQATLNVISLGPYNPNLGAYSGWSSETNLDVQMAHAMAPKAAINLYITTGALSVAEDIAQIISDNSVSVLSMSLSFAAEWRYSLYGADWFYFNMLLPDQFFRIGSLMGITFLCASGDAGGSGYSSGPAGNSGYPSDSPYVTSVGGTQTYCYTAQNGSKISVQTGWSNTAFVPDNFNAGGGGGGVSFLEPKPWYQQKQATPPTYPNGRMEPDLSLQAGAYPGIYMVDNGATTVAAGTSASAPILAGFVALMAQSMGHPLGLINPFLYEVGNNATTYTKGFTPITFGYNIPWVASYGYNLVTGWGAPNIGGLTSLYQTLATQKSLSIDVYPIDALGNSPYNALPNQIIDVFAVVTDSNGVPIESGNFTAELYTLAGSSLATKMTYDATQQAWHCNVTIGQQSGVSYFRVFGSSGASSGQGVSDLFVGYLASFLSPSPLQPYTTLGGNLQVNFAATDLDGNRAPLNSQVVNVNSYSIIANRFTASGTLTLQLTNDTRMGLIYNTTLTQPYPAGPTTLMARGGTYGFLPYTNGIYLQSTIMAPEVCASPGVLAPGQYLAIASYPQAPVNIAEIDSYDTGLHLGADIASGSSITAYLVSPSGQTVASSDLIFDGERTLGYLQVPTSAASGLYTVILRASYGTSTFGVYLYGSFFGQVWVSSGKITPQITITPSSVYMGQTAQITADIHYPNGEEVTQGIYTAAIYPQQLQSQYTKNIYTEYANQQLTTLSYNPTINRWTANITMPSPLNAGPVASLQGAAAYYAGPYDIYITGLSYDGYPTTTDLSAQKAFYLQPYLYIENQTVPAFLQTSGLALNGVTTNATFNLINSIFLDSNKIQSTVCKISESTITGTLQVIDSNLTLVGVHGGNVAASNSNLTLINSDIAALTLANSRVSLSSASYQTIEPSAPTVEIVSPTNGSTNNGDVNINLSVTGNNIDKVTVQLNGLPVTAFNKNGTLSYTLQSVNYPDGNYQMQITATQTDGITSTVTSTFNLNNQANSQQSNLNALNSTVSALRNQLAQQTSNSNLAQSNLQNQIDQLESQLNNATNTLATINSTQPTVLNNLGNINDTLSSSLDSYGNQIAELKDSLNTAETFAVAGVIVGLAGIALAVAVAWRRPKK